MLQWLIGLLSSGTGAKVAGSAINTVALSAVAAPAAAWFIHHKDEPFVQLSYGDVAVIGLLLFAVIKAAHYTKPPG